MVKFKIVSAGATGIDYTGSNIYVAFGVVDVSSGNGWEQYFFATSCEGETFCGLELFTDYPYEMEIGQFPSFVPKPEYDEYLRTIIACDDENLYVFWQELLTFCEENRLNSKAETNEFRKWLEAQAMENFGYLPKASYSPSDARAIIQDYFNSIECGMNNQWLVIYNAAMRKMNEPYRQIYKTAQILEMIRSRNCSLAEITKMVRSFDFDPDLDFHYFQNGHLCSTDCVEDTVTADDVDDAISYMIDHKDGCGDSYIQSIVDKV